MWLGSQKRGAGLSRRGKVDAHLEWESPSTGNVVQGDNHGGNFALFSKLIFKATPEANLLLLVGVLIKIQ